MIVNLGDCVSGPLWSRETAELLQSLAIHTVRGNHDRVVGEGASPAMGASDRFASDRVTEMQRCWLAQLPFTLEIGAAGCIHANPRDDLDYLIDDVADGRLLLAKPQAISARLGDWRHRLILCGHSHQPRVIRLPEGSMIVNPGSVGCPAYLDPGSPAHISETGAPHARFALLTVRPKDIRTELIAVEYDWDDAAATAEKHGRPDWARALRTGYAG